MTDPLLPVILSLDACARSIDETFATAGARLGQALSVFETTHSRLGTVSDELSTGSGMARMREGVMPVVTDLRAFSSGLSVEANTLQAIAGHGQVVARSFRQLAGCVGFLIAVARCARTESAWLRNAQDGPGFFGTIGALVDRAKQSVDECIAGHLRLKSLLSSATATQAEFATNYGTRLAAFADQLERSLAAIEDSQDQGTRLAAEAALQSRAIADSASTAIVALQCGDSTRQRLEHALAVLRSARAVAAGDCASASCLAEADRALLLRVLHSLASAQLRDTAATMRHDIGDIDTTLHALGAGMSAGRGAGEPLDDHSARSSQTLAALDTDLASASVLLGRCNTAREQVDRLTTTLTTFLDQFRQTARSLSGTVSDIVLLGMNARLHASRVGAEGRVLVAIAQEIKSAADGLVEEAAQLSPTFERMHELVGAMQNREVGGSDRIASLDGTMRRMLAAMKQKRADLVGSLEQLAADSSTYAAQVAEARLAFAAATTAALAIEAAATAVEDRLADLPPAHEPTDAAPIEAFLDEEVFQHYTMAAERRLHETALAEHGLRSLQAGTADDPASTDLDAVFAF